jgi:hypothetical protein
MAVDLLHLLKRAQHQREQAERARRLANATTAGDVAERLLLYAGRLDEQARKLEDRAVQLQRSADSPTQSATRQGPGTSSRAPTKPR